MRAPTTSHRLACNSCHGTKAVITPSITTLLSGGALALVLALSMAGCGGNARPSGTGEASTFTDDEALDQPDENSIVLEHDFGLLKPGEAVTHSFQVTNPTQETWTIQRIVNMCACTATDLTSPSIAPQETEEVTVTFEPGNAPSDESRKVIILFAEPEASQVFLVVKAKVRDDLTLEPSSISFPDLGREQTGHRRFEVQNYGDTDWRAVELKSSVDWIRATAAELEFEPSADTPRQIWNIDVTADAAGLSLGKHKAQITVAVKREEQDDILQTLPVNLDVTAAVAAIPSQWFFGRITAGQPKQQTVIVRFAPDAIPTDPADVAFEHDFGEQLDLIWLNCEGNRWELQATLTLSPEADLRDRRVQITFPSSSLPTLTLPVYASIGASAAVCTEE